MFANFIIAIIEHKKGRNFDKVECRKVEFENGTEKGHRDVWRLNGKKNLQWLILKWTLKCCNKNAIKVTMEYSEYVTDVD